jgi:hypothetical protein
VDKESGPPTKKHFKEVKLLPESTENQNATEAIETGADQPAEPVQENEAVASEE